MVTCEQGYLAKLGGFGNGLPRTSKERAMAQNNTKKLVSSTTMIAGSGYVPNDKTLLLLFTVGEHNYRMRVACVHVHPGELDHIEIEGKDMIGGTTWTRVPDGGFGPSPEWLIRRALWSVFSNGLKVTDSKLMIVEMGTL